MREISFIAKPVRGRTIPLASSLGNRPGQLPAGHPVRLDASGSPWSPYQWHPPARLNARFPAEESALISPQSLNNPRDPRA
jgi:hypothetical protein